MLDLYLMLLRYFISDLRHGESEEQDGYQCSQEHNDPMQPAHFGCLLIEHEMQPQDSCCLAI